MNIGDHFVTGPWRHVPREIVIEGVPGEGVDDVKFRFLDTDEHSSCSHSAFLRTYQAVSD